MVAPPQGAVHIAFQEAAGHRAPAWPPVHGEQRTMMRFDFQMDDLDLAVADAVALGATPAAHQPRDHVRVLLDPAGHPFGQVLIHPAYNDRTSDEAAYRANPETTASRFWSTGSASIILR